MIASNFCYERARDLFSFPVDRKLKSINPIVKNIENPSRTTALVAENDEIKIVTYMFHENANLWRPFIFDTIELETFSIFHSIRNKYECINEYEKFFEKKFYIYY